MSALIRFILTFLHLTLIPRIIVIFMWYEINVEWNKSYKKDYIIIIWHLQNICSFAKVSCIRLNDSFDFYFTCTRKGFKNRDINFICNLQWFSEYTFRKIYANMIWSHYKISIKGFALLSQSGINISGVIHVTGKIFFPF